MPRTNFLFLSDSTLAIRSQKYFSHNTIVACHYLLIYRKSYHRWSRYCENHVAPVLLSTFPSGVLQGFRLSNNILVRSFYRTNLTIIGCCFSPGCLDWPILWLLSMSWGAISISKFSLFISLIISSFSSPITFLNPYTRRQFLLEYCFCWSACFSGFETLVDKVLTFN